MHTLTFRDTSAAAITASAFIELSGYTGDQTYLDAATTILTSLSAAPYLGDPALTDAVLVGNAHDCGSDYCTDIYTDAYFLEALRRLRALSQK
jgi:unsaturated chondroitin disaccharide hydrolase